MTRTQLINAVRAYATENYTKDGWDILVECWDDPYIAEIIGKARTEKGAIAACRKVTKSVASFRRDIQMA